MAQYAVDVRSGVVTDSDVDVVCDVLADAARQVTWFPAMVSSQVNNGIWVIVTVPAR
jgi:hypothetical protein